MADAAPITPKNGVYGGALSDDISSLILLRFVLLLLLVSSASIVSRCGVWVD